MNEIWEHIKGFECGYSISNKGRVKSHHRNIIMKQQVVNGMFRVSLTKGGKKNHHHCYVHRLVAEHFIENPKNYRLVKHIDNNILNNDVSNLMWVEYYEVLNHDRKPYVNKIFYMYDLNGKLEQTFYSLAQATEYLKSIGHDKANHTGINRACSGVLKTYLGYVWKFDVGKQEEEEETLDKLKKSYDALNIEYLEMKKILIKLLRGERLTEEERLDVTILKSLYEYFNKEKENENNL